MIFYTIQNQAFYNKRLEEGSLMADPNYIWAEFQSAYLWMISQAQKKISNYPQYPQDLQYPIWLWVKRPDLRHSAHLPSGEKGILLTVELPLDKVLLSDFDAWHMVLNNYPCVLNEMEEKKFEQEQDKNSQKQFKENSWERIFDLELIRKSEFWNSKNSSTTQGITASVPFKNIIQTKTFIAR